MNTPFRAAVLAAVMVVLVLVGCDMWKSDGYTWVPKPEWRSTTYVWYKLAPADMAFTCGGSEFSGCAYPVEGGTCNVYDIYEEDEARRVKVNGVTLFDHEVGPGSANGRVSYNPPPKIGHCAGFNHTERHVRAAR